MVKNKITALILTIISIFMLNSCKSDGVTSSKENTSSAVEAGETDETDTNEKFIIINGTMHGAVEIDIDATEVSIHTKLLNDKFDDAELEKLAKLTKLESLTVNISDEQSKYLLNIPNLKVLNLYNSEISDNFYKNFESLTSLEELTIGVSEIDKKNLDFLKNSVNLKSLKIYDQGEYDISGISNLKNLNELYLIFESIKDYSPICELTQLKKISLPTSVTNDELIAIEKAIPEFELVLDDEEDDDES